VRPNPKFAVTDERVVRALIDENSWGTLVSHTEDGLVASHYPVLLDECSEELAVLTHVGRPDDQLHRFGTSEMLLIIAGPHGYISPSCIPSTGRRLPPGTSALRTATGSPRSWRPRRTSAC
jgi:transcriptional regulator